MYQISKKFTFSASHQLRGLPQGHQCARLHGHNYTVKVTLQSSTLDEAGFVVDYGELAFLRQHLDSKYDHRHLNDFMQQPTAENIACELFKFCREYWPETYSVSVSETDKTWATYWE